MNADPGWRVRVEHDDAVTERAASVRHDRVAADVPEGASRVSFRYRPPGFGTGIALFIATVAAFGLLAVRETRRAA